MKKQVLFIHGGGVGGFEEDQKLATSLQKVLGAAYHVHYPRMPSDKTKPDFGWLQKIGSEVGASDGDLILVGHSLGASMLLKYLSENELRRNVAGLFLIATPFWSGDEDWVQGLKLTEDFAHTLPKDIPFFLYHCRDDEEVPFDTLAIYEQRLPHAVIRPIERGGHQLDNDLSAVAEDIKSL
jgi:uncharacterized protein